MNGKKEENKEGDRDKEKQRVSENTPEDDIDYFRPPLLSVKQKSLSLISQQRKYENREKKE